MQLPVIKRFVERSPFSLGRARLHVKFETQVNNIFQSLGFSEYSASCLTCVCTGKKNLVLVHIPDPVNGETNTIPANHMTGRGEGEICCEFHIVLAICFRSPYIGVGGVGVGWVKGGVYGC